MPRGTTPLPLHSGQAIPSWAAIALRMKALLLGSLFRNSANSSSTLNATTAVLGSLRDIRKVLNEKEAIAFVSLKTGAYFRKHAFLLHAFGATGNFPVALRWSDA